MSDFGLSTLPQSVGTQAILNTACGTPHYVSPEIIQRKGYTGAPADIWSLGVILYVMLSGSLPFDDTSLAELFRKINKAEYQVPPWFSPEVSALLKKILCPDPRKRATLAEIREDPWFAVNYRPVEVAPLETEPGEDEREHLFDSTVQEEKIEGADAEARGAARNVASMERDGLIWETLLCVCMAPIFLCIHAA